MKNYVLNLSISKAAVTVGVAFIASLIIVTIIDDFLLSNFVVPGDTDLLAIDIQANNTLFGLAVIGYLVVLVLDAIIGLALFVVLKSANQVLAMITSALRLLYAVTLVLGLFALVFQSIDVYGYALIKQIGYVFFTFHLFALGFSIIHSGYLPKSLGVLLIIASFTYVVFFIDHSLPDMLTTVLMLIMALAELSLSIWLIAKRNHLPENSV